MLWVLTVFLFQHHQHHLSLVWAYWWMNWFFFQLCFTLRIEGSPSHCFCKWLMFSAAVSTNEMKGAVFTLFLIFRRTLFSAFSSLLVRGSLFGTGYPSATRVLFSSSVSMRGPEPCSFCTMTQALHQYISNHYNKGPYRQWPILWTDYRTFNSTMTAG